MARPAYKRKDAVWVWFIIAALVAFWVLAYTRG